MNVLRAFLERDLAREIRGGGLAEVVLFGAAAVLASSFALPPDPALARAAAPGILWTVLLFAALLLAQRRIAEAERAGLLEFWIGNGVAPVSILAAETVSLLLSLAVAAVVLVPVLVLFTGVSLRAEAGAALALGVAGLAVAATGLSLLTRAARRREVLFPVLFLLSVLPVVLPAAAVTGGTIPASSAIGLLGGFDLALASLLAWVAEDLFVG